MATTAQSFQTCAAASRSREATRSGASARIVSAHPSPAASNRSVVAGGKKSTFAKGNLKFMCIFLSRPLVGGRRLQIISALSPPSGSWRYEQSFDRIAPDDEGC
eukprot:1196192-Prorocentrum_minimum.AAC.7